MCDTHSNSVSNSNSKSHNKDVFRNFVNGSIPKNTYSKNIMFDVNKFDKFEVELFYFMKYNGYNLYCTVDDYSLSSPVSVQLNYMDLEKYSNKTLYMKKSYPYPHTTEHQQEKQDITIQLTIFFEEDDPYKSCLIACFQYIQGEEILIQDEINQIIHYFKQSDVNDDYILIQKNRNGIIHIDPLYPLQV